MDNHKKHSLGHRAFFIFLASRLKIPILLFAVSFGIWYSERWMTGVNLDWTAYAAQLAFVVSGAYFLLIFCLTYVEYRVYTYTFTEEAFLMTSGLAVRNEVAALYHQIQNVNISRSPLDRLIGVSQIVIFMTGTDREMGHNKIVLPAVGKKKAKLVQKELLIRARKEHSPVA